MTHLKGFTFLTTLVLVFFWYDNKEKYPIHVLKQYFEEKYVELLLIGEEEKNTMFLSIISIDSCMTIHYILKENIFVAIVYILSLQKKS